MSVGQVGDAPAVSPSVELSTGEDDVGHLVCCRDPAWLGGTFKALCGFEDDGGAGVTADVVCSMCAEEAERLRPGYMSEAEDICPFDGRPCPDMMALAEMVARRVLPE